MRVGDQQPGTGIGDDAGGEFGRAGGVERDGENSAQQAAEEYGDPLGGVGTPEDDAVAGSDVAAVELGGEAAGERGELAVGGAVGAVAAMGDDSRLAGVRAKVIDEAGEVRPHGTRIDAQEGERLWPCVSFPTVL